MMFDCTFYILQTSMGSVADTDIIQAKVTTHGPYCSPVLGRWSYNQGTEIKTSQPYNLSLNVSSIN